MASGTPVICSNTSSLPEVAGDAAMLVDPGDVDGWREALQHMVDDTGLRQDLARRGLERSASFTWAKAAQQTWAVLDEASTA